MKAIHGRLDHLFLTPGEERLMLEGEIYRFPETDHYALLRRIQGLGLAKMAKVPVTIEVDDSDVVRAGTTVLEGHTISFALPDGRTTISCPADGCPCRDHLSNERPVVSEGASD
jgi:hypothetical protein